MVGQCLRSGEFGKQQTDHFFFQQRQGRRQVRPTHDVCAQLAQQRHDARVMPAQLRYPVRQERRTREAGRHGKTLQDSNRLPVERGVPRRDRLADAGRHVTAGLLSTAGIGERQPTELQRSSPRLLILRNDPVGERGSADAVQQRRNEIVPVLPHQRVQRENPGDAGGAGLPLENPLDAAAVRPDPLQGGRQLRGRETGVPAQRFQQRPQGRPLPGQRVDLRGGALRQRPAAAERRRKGLAMTECVPQAFQNPGNAFLPAIQTVHDARQRTGKPAHQDSPGTRRARQMLLSQLDAFGAAVPGPARGHPRDAAPALAHGKARQPAQVRPEKHAAAGDARPEPLLSLGLHGCEIMIANAVRSPQPHHDAVPRPACRARPE